MTIRVTGSSSVMDALAAARPKYMDELRLDNDEPNYALMEELAALGLWVEVRREYTDPTKDVCIDPDTGPYCPLPGDEVETDDDEDLDDDDY